MIGHVDGFGRALIKVSVLPANSEKSTEIDAWIDTGFNGDLVLPQSDIDDLGLSPSGTIKATLADGSEIALQPYACYIDWFGEMRDTEIVANDGEFPLLGVGLLVGHELKINYRSGEITID